MGVYTNGNIGDVFVGNSKIDKVFIGNDLVYQSEDPTLIPLYFEVVNPSVTSTVKFRKASTENFDDPSGVDFSKYTGYSDPSWSYSYDGESWTNYSIGSSITIGGSGSPRVYFKSRVNYTSIPWRGSYTDSSSKITTTSYTFLQFTASGGAIVSGGNILSLLYSSFTTYDSTLDYCYFEMFRGCTSLTSAPNLPATTLASNCYSNIFYGCTSLTSAPSLPATTLADMCYLNMFYGCTSLTSAPSLPATTLADMCYFNMFYGCTSLTSAPALPATTLASSCYSYMFYGCTSLTSAPNLPATTLASSCYLSMFYGCTSLTSAPALPATTLASSCYSNMFCGCTSLTSAPSLPATTLASSCYYSMFMGCTSLTSAPSLPATTLADMCYAYMFNHIIVDGQVTNGVKASNTQSAVCAYPFRIPNTGTGIAAADTDPLNNMFSKEGEITTIEGYTPTINTTFYISIPTME